MTNQNKPLKIAIIGGGVAGSTTAIRLATAGVQTYLFEKNASLINSPPMCHLHAGGNLYREISDDDCKILMRQCIDIVKLYPNTIDVRPTIIAVPKRELKLNQETAEELLPRLELLHNYYQSLIDQDPTNQVLGKAEDYYRLYSRDNLEKLATLEVKKQPQTTDDWLIGYAKLVDLDKLQYPIIAVQEYGWNIFRLSASAGLQLENLSNAHVFCDTKVTDLESLKEPFVVSLSNHPSTSSGRTQMEKTQNGWQVYYSQNNGETQNLEVDYVINACGFRTGIIDDKVGVKIERMVEFKASYLAEWQEFGYPLPEMIFHGERGTPHGMAQFTPYCDGIFQMHGMTETITLFKDGLTQSNEHSSQPPINPQYLNYIQKGWDKSTLKIRTQNAIRFVAEFVPNFANATPIDNALYGGQQVPSDDISTRVADIRPFADKNYIIAENVKATSALEVADNVVDFLIEQNLLDKRHSEQPLWHKLDVVEVEKIAEQLAKDRKYPVKMAKVNQSLKLV